MSDPKDYTVGWICALSTEYVAAQAFLDEKHEGPDFVSSADSNDYTLGRMGKHNIVIAVLPDGEYGLSSATGVAKDMLHTFTNIRFGLMVGIGGGAPTQKYDIRLGDIVVSAPRNGESGVFQYDFGKTIQEQTFQTTGFLNQPPVILRTAVNGLKSHYELEGHQLKEAIDYTLEKKSRLKKKYKRPDRGRDTLYQSTVIHLSDKGDCSAVCGQDPTNLVLRSERTEDEDAPVVHYGQIASANQLMKNALVRDKLATEKDVLCFEMEAAGLMNNFPCLVVRGICDYADSHKNKEWQGYAAMAAAAYSKDLLCRITPTRIEAEVKIIDILSDIQGDVSELRRAQHNEEYETILNWLTPIEYASQQNDNFNRRQPGTGQWFLDSSEFQTWLETRGQTLFCQGIPGSGKTIMASQIIHQLHGEHQDSTDVGIAYIYYNFRRQQQQDPVDILASLLKQLSRGLDRFPASVAELYEENRRQQTRPSLDELSRQLQIVARHYTKTFIIIDALDECRASDRARHQLLEQLFNLQAETAANLLATSRFSPDIEKFFEGRSLRLEIKASEDDLQRYLDGGLQILPSFVWRSEELQHQVKTAIVEAVDGMFLLAKLHLASLVGKRSPKALISALGQLSTGSDAYYNAYNETMERINGQAPDIRELAKQTLSWITCAYTPLTITELRHALAVELDQSSFDEQNLSDIEDILSACAGLVTVDDESNIIRLVHYTTQQYFERTQTTWFPNSQEDIADTCITYLSFDVFKSGPCRDQLMYTSRLQLNPFYEYAACNWGHHVRLSFEDDLQSLLAFLRDEKVISATCQVLMRKYEDDWTLYQKFFPLRMTAAHLAAWFGLSSALEASLETTRSPNDKNSYGETPLLLAAKNGQEEIVKLLTRRIDIEVNAQTIGDKTPLLYAAQNGNTSIVRQLMTRHDLDVNAAAIKGVTPLYQAVREGHEAMVELLLTHRKVDGNLTDTSGQTPLYLAVLQNSAGIVRLLLAREDIKTRLAERLADQAYYGTPLTLAAGAGFQQIVKELLTRHDLEVNAPDKHGRTPLMRAALSGHTEIVNMLMAHPDVKLSLADSSKETPLSIGIRYDYMEIVQSLLMHQDAAVSFGDDWLMVPSWVAKNGHMDLLNLLLERSWTDLNSKDKEYGRKPLAWAAMHGRLEAVQFLITRAQVDLDPKDDESGRTPLSWAAGNGHIMIVQTLLALEGVDPNSTDNSDRTPLSWAARNGHLDVVNELLACSNINANLKSTLGRTPLSYAAEAGHDAVVKVLLTQENGNIDSKDISFGRTPLSLAAGNGHTAVVQELLTRTGVDLNSRSKYGATPLTWAARYGHAPVVQLLLENGADLDVQDDRGRTPLSWAENKEHTSVVELLRSWSTEVLMQL